MRILVNHSVYPSDNWSEEQKKGWGEIVDIPFPAVDPTWELSQVEELVEKNLKEIEYELSIIVAEPGPEIWLCLLGEYTYVYCMLKRLIADADPVVDGIAIPTTERVQEDGGKEVLRFVRWRLIPLRR